MFEFQQIFDILQPKIIFCDADISEIITEAVTSPESEITIVLLNSNPVRNVKMDVEYPHTKIEEFIKKDVDFTNFRPVPSEDTSKSIALLACSSGTTGLPKAVMHSDRNIIFQIFSWRNLALNQAKQMRWLHVSHFFWITGISLFIVCTSGLQERIIVRNITSKNILHAIDTYKPGVTFLTPALIDIIINDPEFDNYDVTSLKFISTGGAALQSSTAKLVLSKWPTPVRLIQGYGCTEVCGLFTSMASHHDLASVGSLIPGTKLKILKGDGEIADHGELGELCLQSPSLMIGYANNEEATREAIDNEGWWHSGDIGYVKNGVVYLTGRIKELIKYKGMQIAPAEVEELIRSVSGVADVGVAGIKIDAYTYHPMALVVKTVNSEVTEEDIVKCVNENLSEYKHLRAGVCFVDEIPRTPTGKIKRKMLQSLADTLYMGD